MTNFLFNVAPLFHYIVRGDSMWPTLRSGEHLLAVKKGIFARTFSVGDIVVLRHPREPQREIIKRITSISESGDYFVEGDNKAMSDDSRLFGSIPEGLVAGRILG